MIEVLSYVLIAVYQTVFFILGCICFVPLFQSLFKLKSGTAVKCLIITTLYTIGAVVFVYLLKQVGISNSNLLYTLDSLLLFYLVYLFGCFTLRKVER